MSIKSWESATGRAAVWARGSLVFFAAAAMAVLAGCSTSSSTTGGNGSTPSAASGGGTSSTGGGKPAYCAYLTSLQNDIKGLTSLNPSSGVSGLEAQLQKIQNDSATLVNSAKGEFPSQTSALKSSVIALQNAVKGLQSSPSAAQIAAIAKDAASVVSSVKNLTDAASPRCG
ncbi:MAG: hypothetical protein JOY82_06430 [Streptosporangiaceae bacterium]|nr:hypothetical protein [Streptosporangiaceae bacterium]MBV9854147.1 hypothetical protein [Streptosporangiaceae bacterium]